MPSCAYTYLNEVTPHPVVLREVGGQNSGESHTNSGSGTNKDTNTNSATDINYTSRCPNGCLPPTSFDFKSSHDIPRIAYYIAGDTAKLRDPRVPKEKPYDPIPNHTSCQVMILPTKIWDMILVVNPEYWLPCWIVSFFFCEKLFQRLSI